MSGFMVRPMDWVSFGPPRPSSAGESHRRTTQIPPTPTTFQGIVRTALLRAAGVDLVDRSSSAQGARDALVGLPERLPSGWQLRGPFVTDIDDGTARPWVTTPRFLLGKDQSGPVRSRRLASPAIAEGPTSLNDLSSGNEPLLLGHPEATKPLGGWLSPRGLRWALSGGIWNPSDHRDELPPFIKRHILPGLSIEQGTGAAQDGMLFFGEVLRFSGLSGMAGWLSGALPSPIPADALTRGELATCGYKSRPAVLEALPALDPDWQHVMEGRHLPAEAAEGEPFFLVALTPIPCARGSLAKAIEEDLRHHGSLPAGVEVRVLGALTGKPRVIGGLAAASRRSRSNRSYWAAGSAFLFELHGGSASDRAAALQRFNNAHPLGSRDEASFGYGHTLVAIGEPKEGRT